MSLADIVLEVDTVPVGIIQVASNLGDIVPAWLLLAFVQVDSIVEAYIALEEALEVGISLAGFIHSTLS